MYCGVVVVVVLVVVVDDAVVVVESVVVVAFSSKTSVMFKSNASKSVKLPCGGEITHKRELFH